MLMVTSLTLGLIDGLTLNGSLTLTDKGSVTELDLLIRGNGLVFNEAVFNEVLLALLLLLGLEISSVSGVALLAVAMLALDDIIVFGLLNHHNLVNTPLASSSNGANVKGDIITATSPLAGITGRHRLNSVGSMVVVIVMGMVITVSLMLVGLTSVGLVEGEGAPQVLSSPPLGSSS